MRAKHYVYVVELSKEVLDVKKFVNSNPAYVTGMSCVYVGKTGLDPDVRLATTKQQFAPTNTSCALVSG